MTDVAADFDEPDWLEHDRAWQASEPADFASAEDQPQPATVPTLTLASAGAGARLIRFVYGIGIPSRLLTSPFGRVPRPRLLATVENPLPGNRIAGTALRAGHFLVHGAKLAFAAADYGPAAKLALPFADALHGFSWLADLEASAPREQGAPIAERLLADWLAANPKPPRRPARAGPWTVAHTGARLLAWLVHAPLILSSHDRATRARTLQVIAAHARWLDAHARRAPDQLGETAAWCALAATGLLLPGGRPRLLHAEAALIRSLGELVGDDGGVLSRSPLAQIEAIALLVKLRACYRACRRAPAPAIETMLALLVPPLLALTHSDGSLGSWQGGWGVDAATVSRVVAASGVRRRPAQGSRQWGYHRMVAQRSVVQFDAAPPPLPRYACHGCASTLAFEFSHGELRLVVNCGGAAAAGGLVPPAFERGLRATAAHSTLTLDQANSSAVLTGGRIGAGVGAVDVERRAIEPDTATRGARGSTRIEASHDGYAGRYGLIHHRVLVLCDDGQELRGEDRLKPAKRRGRRRKVGFAVRFHLGPEVTCFAIDGGHGAQLALPDGSCWLFRAVDGEVSIDDSVWVDGDGCPIATRQLVLHDVVGRAGGCYAWSFTLVG